VSVAKHIPIAVFCGALLLSTASCEHNPVPSKAQAEEFHCMLKNIYHEARGDTVDGMRAVALVTLNRVAEKDKTVCEIVYEHKQFSWTFMKNIRNKALTDNVNAVHAVAADAVAGRLNDITNGATYYHAKSVKPYWVKAVTKVGAIGAHIFYRKKL
jgi:spore germination cell wall hydrolase CwlJ-like protein